MKIFKLFQKKNNELNDIIKDSKNLKGLAQGLFVQSENLKRLVLSIKESVQKSSTASLEISETVVVTASAAVDLETSAQSSFEAMERSVESRRQSSEYMEQVTAAIEGLQDSVETGLKEISSILGTMSSIQEKSKMINDIVFQTKLLSFNASVEAARAGEAGKGFAVVAEEMGKLARQSGRASQEIEAIILEGIAKTKTQIDDVTHRLAQAVEFANEAMGQVNQSRQEVTLSLEELNTGTIMTNDKSKQISVATSEQSIGVSEINRALEELEVTTHTLEKMAQDNYDASISINEMTDTLNLRIIRLAGERAGQDLNRQDVAKFDFDAAIKAHIDWKMKLGKYLLNPDGSLNSKVVCQDNQCALGKWLYNEGAQYKKSHHHEYETLRASHAEFHSVAGQIIENIDQKKIDEAKFLLSPSGPYMKVSDQTVALIQKLKAKVGDESASAIKVKAA